MKEKTKEILEMIETLERIEFTYEEYPTEPTFEITGEVIELLKSLLPEDHKIYWQKKQISGLTSDDR